MRFKTFVSEGFMENQNFNRVMRTLSRNGYDGWGLTNVEAAELIAKLEKYMRYAGPDKIRPRLGGSIGSAIDALNKQMGHKAPASPVHSRHTFFSQNGKMEVVVSDEPFDDWPCTVIVSKSTTITEGKNKDEKANQIVGEIIKAVNSKKTQFMAPVSLQRGMAVVDALMLLPKVNPKWKFHASGSVGKNGAHAFTFIYNYDSDSWSEISVLLEPKSTDIRSTSFEIYYWTKDNFK